ncbi:DUF7660 family protein [Vallitalea okinawensis]|uniref:DUF7660 family protein n=1 Tax=Vallitalea okinawensis TaxID=2078660 RepID=UPI001A9A5B36|nr:hypothetical protein [Vallitalea okinawensis]
MALRRKGEFDELKEIRQALERVSDEKSFIEFLQVLSNDYLINDESWENHSIDTFLESSKEWAEVSINGLDLYEKENNIWKRCADILYMGKIYE